MQALDDGGGRTGAHGDGVPAHHLGIGEARLGEGGHGRQGGQAFGSQHGQRPQLARLDMLERERPRQQAHLQASLEKIGQAGRNAAIGHRGHVELVLVLQQLGRQVDRRAVARVEIVELARIGAAVVDQLLQRLHRHRRIDHGHGGRDGDQRHGLEVGQRIVGDRLEVRHHDVGNGGHDPVVAVGRRLRDQGGGQRRVAAGLGFDHDRLAEIDLHWFGHRTRHDVDDAAHRVGHQKAHGLGGERLREGARCHGKGRHRADDGATLQSIHCLPPWCRDARRPSLPCHHSRASARCRR